MFPSWFSFWSQSSKAANPLDSNPTSIHDQSDSNTTSTVIPDELTSSNAQESHRDSTKAPTPPHKNRSAVLFTAGLTFSLLSILVTRRAFARRRLTSTPPAFYKDAPSHTAAQTAKVSGPIEAIEALNLASINVISLTMMGTGGALWYLGIENMDDARRLFRGSVGVDGMGGGEREAEENFEEWLATTLSRKEAKERAKGGKNEDQEI